MAEQGSRELVLAKYLEKKRKTLRLYDHFFLRNRGEVDNFLKDNDCKSCRACPLHAKGLSYSIPHGLLLTPVKNCIEQNGTVSFQNTCFICVDALVDLITYYLRVKYV